MDNGYINVSKLCGLFNKKIGNWKQNEDFRTLLDIISIFMNINASKTGKATINNTELTVDEFIKQNENKKEKSSIKKDLKEVKLFLEYLLSKL